MDYKYIEQLLERYFAGETTLTEERILDAFFSQEEIPAELKEYQPLFTWKDTARIDEQLSDGFDARMLSMIGAEEQKKTSSALFGDLSSPAEPQAVRARSVSLSQRLAPLFRAAAIVAIILTLGNAMRLSMKDAPQGTDDINYAEYKDTYDDPAVAYDRVEDALQLMSQGLSLSQSDDSLIQSVRTYADSIKGMSR